MDTAGTPGKGKDADNQQHQDPQYTLGNPRLPVAWCGLESGFVLVKHSNCHLSARWSGFCQMV
jgi:hypothetical protein